VALGSGDKITYWWIKSGTAGNYGDRTQVPPLPAGAQTTMTLPVITPSVAGAYTLRVQFVHEPSTWFGPLELPVTVT
jgi:hypothetical protein